MTTMQKKNKQNERKKNNDELTPVTNQSVNYLLLLKTISIQSAINE